MAEPMRRPTRPLFLARESYRKRRLIDAIRLVPVLGALLFLVPLLSAAGQVGSTFRGGLYLFGSWLFLIVLTALLERRLRRSEAVQERAGGGRGGGDEGGRAGGTGDGAGGDGGAQGAQTAGGTRA